MDTVHGTPLSPALTFYPTPSLPTPQIKPLFFFHCVLTCSSPPGKFYQPPAQLSLVRFVCGSVPLSKASGLSQIFDAKEGVWRSGHGTRHTPSLPPTPPPFFLPPQQKSSSPDRPRPLKLKNPQNKFFSTVHAPLAPCTPIFSLFMRPFPLSLLPLTPLSPPRRSGPGGLSKPNLARHSTSILCVCLDFSIFSDERYGPIFPPHLSRPPESPMAG